MNKAAKTDITSEMIYFLLFSKKIRNELIFFAMDDINFENEEDSDTEPEHYQEDRIFVDGSDSDSEYDSEPDDIAHWFAPESITESAFTVADINFEEETKERSELRPSRLGHDRPVEAAELRKNGKGTEIDLLTPELCKNPGDIYDLVYGNSLADILICTNRAVTKHNLNTVITSHVKLFTLHEIKQYFGIRIIIMLEKGKHVSIQTFYQQRLLPKEYEFFSVLPGLSINHVDILPFRRFRNIIRFINMGGPKMYIDKLKFIKRTGQRHILLGGEFQPIMQRNNPTLTCKTLDLEMKIRPIEKHLIIIQKNVSKTQPFIQYNKNKTNKYGLKFYHLNDVKTTYIYRSMMQYPSQFVEREHRTVVGLTLDMTSDFENSGINLTVDKYYTSIELIVKLYKKCITLLGVVNSNVLNRYFNTEAERNRLKT